MSADQQEPMSMPERVGYLEGILEMLLDGKTDLDIVRAVYTENYVPRNADARPAMTVSADDNRQ